MKLQIFLLMLLALPSLSRAAIFGVDDREFNFSKSPSLPQVKATAIAVLSANISYSPQKNSFNLDTNSMDQLVCKDERFATDPSLSYACTGFLVASNLIATAGHCMVNTGEARNETETYCKVFSWLFDYRQDAQGKVKLEQISTDKLYRCKRVIYAVRDETPPFRDFALVELERPVTDRKPLKINAGPLKPGERYSMIGYPLGTPAKRSFNAKILFNNPSRQSFITNLDAFEGNSGSPVLNSSNEVIGILTGGNPIEYLVNRPNENCQVYNRCDEDGNFCRLMDKDTSVFPGYQRLGSEVQRIAPLLETMRDHLKKR